MTRSSVTRPPVPPWPVIRAEDGVVLPVDREPGHWHHAAMRGLMQDYPLTIDAIFRHVEQHYGDGTIVTNGPDGITRSTYAEWAQRTRRLGGVLDTLRLTHDGR